MTVKSKRSLGAGIALAILILLGACKEKSQTLRIIYSADEPNGLITEKIMEILDDNPKLNAELIIGEGSMANVDSLLAGTADLAIIDNNTPNNQSIKSILAFYPQILHILYESETKISDFNALVEHRKVFIGNEGTGTYRFMMDLFRFYRTDVSTIEFMDNPFNCEVYCAFGDIIRDENLSGLEQFKLFSFGDPNMINRGSVADAISLKYPQLSPFIIPRNTYGDLTSEPILTISVDAVLVARKGISSDVIYSLTKTLFQRHQEFNDISPLIYLDMNERFDTGKLNFPLHDGARVYLEKDEPGFLERFAELIGVIFTLIIAGISGIVSIAKWRKQAKKDRIDLFYKKVIDIKNSIEHLQTPEEVDRKLLDLEECKEEAFGLLIDEKLAANESFRIYMELNKEIQGELELKKAELYHLNKTLTIKERQL